MEGAHQALSLPRRRCFRTRNTPVTGPRHHVRVSEPPGSSPLSGAPTPGCPPSNLREPRTHRPRSARFALGRLRRARLGRDARARRPPPGCSGGHALPRPPRRRAGRPPGGRRAGHRLDGHLVHRVLGEGQHRPGLALRRDPPGHLAAGVGAGHRRAWCSGCGRSTCSSTTSTATQKVAGRRHRPRRDRARLAELPARVHRRLAARRACGPTSAAATWCAAATASSTCSRTTCGCRRACRTCWRTGRSPSGSSPTLFRNLDIQPVDDYPTRLYEMLASLSPRPGDVPVIAVLTPGIHNSAYFEHAFLAPQMGAQLVEGSDLVVDDDDVVSGAHRRRPGPGRRDLPPGRRPLPRPRGVPPRLAPRRPRAHAGVAAAATWRSPTRPAPASPTTRSSTPTCPSSSATTSARNRCSPNVPDLPVPRRRRPPATCSTTSTSWW